MSEWSQEELDAGREWRRQRAQEYRQSPDGRREAMGNLAKDLLIPIGFGLAALFLMWALNGFKTGESPLTTAPAPATQPQRK